MRLGTWVQPVRRLLGVLTFGALAIAGLGLALRTSWPAFADFVETNTSAVRLAVGLLAFAAALAVGTIGASWYGLRSISSQLHLAYEMGVRKQTLVGASLISHLADAAWVTALIATVCLGLGVAPTQAVMLLPTVTVMSAAVGAACFVAEPKQIGAPSLSAPGLGVGLGLSMLGLIIALHPILSLSIGPIAIASVGGAAWVFRKALEDASFSIM